MKRATQTSGAILAGSAGGDGKNGLVRTVFGSP
jgi:hypothetical protein